MACWAFAEQLQDDYDVAKLIKLALLHDLGEIEAGDTFLYSNQRNNAHIEERKCVEKIAAHPGNSIEKMVQNILIFFELNSFLVETADSRQQTADRDLLKVCDR